MKTHAFNLGAFARQRIHAYEHGVIQCADGILRGLFPRFFTYSANYSEKWVVICSDKRWCLRCPITGFFWLRSNTWRHAHARCFIQKDQVHLVGAKLHSKRPENTREDTVQRQDKVELTCKWIYEHGVGVNGTYVERVLSPIGSQQG